MRAVITVIGKDTVGILASISTACAKYKNNILEVTQSVMQDLFVMIMLIDINECTIPFTEFADEMAELGTEMGLSIRAMHEDIFNSMHRI
jgi:ACT domain-containing protein